MIKIKFKNLAEITQVSLENKVLKRPNTKHALASFRYIRDLRRHHVVRENTEEDADIPFYASEFTLAWREQYASWSWALRWN